LLLSLIIPEGLKVLSPSDVSAGSGYIWGSSACLGIETKNILPADVPINYKRLQGTARKVNVSYVLFLSYLWNLLSFNYAWLKHANSQAV
jgi:hypothetical protein